MTEFISTCSMPLAVIFLIVGFFFLVKGADIFVEGSSSIASCRTNQYLCFACISGSLSQ